jgi:hypothetical protein
MTERDNPWVSRGPVEPVAATTPASHLGGAATPQGDFQPSRPPEEPAAKGDTHGFNPYLKLKETATEQQREPTRSGLGLVIPVLAAHGGAGASTCALALADAAAEAGLRVLLIDTADPARSGLAPSCDVEGVVMRGVSCRRGVQVSRRRGIDCRRVAAGQQRLCLPDDVPDLLAWTEGLDGAYDVTIVDIAWDAWRTWGHPSAPAAAWLSGNDTFTAPVVVLHPTRRGLTQLEGLLDQASRAHAEGATAPVKTLVTVGSSPWPPEVLAVASTQARRLLDGGFNMPWDGDLERYGLTTAPSPPALQAAALHVLAGVGVPVEIGKSNDQQRHRRLPWPRGLQSNSERQR